MKKSRRSDKFGDIRSKLEKVESSENRAADMCFAPAGMQKFVYFDIIEKATGQSRVQV